MQGEMAISDLQDTNFNAFAFSDIEILDANLARLPRGNINARLNIHMLLKTEHDSCNSP